MDTQPPKSLDSAMMGRALEQARRAAQIGEVPVGAVIYRGEQVISEAHNQRESLADPTAHAEVLALRAAAACLGTWRLDGCNLVVTLEPCPMCAGAMINARLNKVVYGATDPKMGCVHTLYQLCSDRRFNHHVSVIAGILADDCADLLTQFFQQRR